MKKTILTALATAFLGIVPAMAGTVAGSYVYRVSIPGIVPSGSPATGPSQTFNFSTCGQTGRTGPSLAQCRTAYAGQPGILASLAMSGFQGYQEWTVPTTGRYTITAAGAGGGATPLSLAVGGRGAVMQASLSLVQGDVLQIVVGQAGIDAQVPSGGLTPTDAGGGGGTFVVKKTGTQPLVVAGGGGGANYFNNGSFYGSGGDGTTATTAGTSPAGKSEPGDVAGAAGIGGNGSTTGWGEPGAGFFSNGGFPGWNTANFTVAQGFQAGAVGGFSTNAPSANRYGGFGGGAGAHGNSCIGGGAGGGYSGGGGAAGCAGGGGGGSYTMPGATGIATSDGHYNGVAVGPTLGYGKASSPGSVSITLN
jgi:hypothetical protein